MIYHLVFNYKTIICMPYIYLYIYKNLIPTLVVQLCILPLQDDIIFSEDLELFYRYKIKQALIDYAIYNLFFIDLKYVLTYLM